MNKFFLAATIASTVATTLPDGAWAQSRDTIQIAGSSTVLPFASIVAEEFGQAFPDFKTPVVGSGGSSGGLRQFCAGVGDNTIDIANSSRRIRASEIEECNANGVKDIREIRIGYDGIVFATSASKGDFALEPIHVFNALGAKVHVGGRMTNNPYTNWNQIDASLPDQKISVAIPASNHGTREVFEERVLEEGCKAAGVASFNEKACVTLRQDVVTEIAGDYTETLARLKANPDTIGVFGLSFYEQNRDTLKVASVSGVVPSLETISKGEYPISRPLFFYVKGEHIGKVPGLEDYVRFFISDQMAGAGGRLEEAGLIPAPAEETAKVLAQFEEGQSLTSSDLKQ